MNEVLLRDSLYNVHMKSGASIEYGRGIVVGMVTSLMATEGFPLMDALDIIDRNLPEGWRVECMPEAWRPKPKMSRTEKALWTARQCLADNGQEDEEAEALKVLDEILAQRGCEHLDQGAKSGKLTDFMDIVIYG